MPELLLELFSEEIPARMQERAAADLKAMMEAGLTEAGLAFERSEAHVTPRRLVFVAGGLPEKSPDVREERKGPRVDAPDKAIEGFLRSAGLESLNQCETRTDKKGDYYVAVIERPGEKTPDIVARLVPEVVHKFPWPKSMRWGSGNLRWVRPLHSILCVFDGKIVPFEINGIKSGKTTLGHRFLAHRDAKHPTRPKSISATNFNDYAAALKAANVIVAKPKRAQLIMDEALRLARAKKLDLVEDHGLIDENAGLVEWPVVLMGEFDSRFLALPPEVLVTALKAHQKCFSLKVPKTGKPSNMFIMVSNLAAKDGGKAIIAGNERVIRARLSDATFFWENDKKRPLANLVAKLDEIIFHERLGTLGQRVERIKALARELSPYVGANADDAERAAALAKADLVSETVFEFPELQGVMGRHIALAQNEKPEIANAIAEHYRPQGPSEPVATAPVSIAVGLADKLDMLVCFWTIGEKPTGSKDPYGLRRAALGIIRTILENELRIPLFRILARPFARVCGAVERQHIEEQLKTLEALADHGFSDEVIETFEREIIEAELEERGSLTDLIRLNQKTALNLLAFFADRLKIHLREQGARHDLIDAVFALGGQDDLLMIVRRVEALGRFLETDDGANLLTGVKRASNILRIEEKKEGRSYQGRANAKLFKQKEERALHQAINKVTLAARAALDAEDFEGAMAAMAGLRAPVDAFFDNVTVNTDDSKLRENRLKLLSQIRMAAHTVADFSRIES